MTEVPRGQSDVSFVPGQGVLPGFEDVLGIESAVLAKPEQERFCWEFVTNGGKPGPAYQVAINNTVALLAAQKNASKLLKKDEIRRRITEISSIIQRKYEQEVIASAVRALNFDPAVYFTGDGNIRRVHEWQEQERLGVGLEAKIVDGTLRYIPVFPSPEKAREALAKMLGMNKERADVSVGVSGLKELLDEISRRHDHRDIVKDKGRQVS